MTDEGLKKRVLQGDLRAMSILLQRFNQARDWQQFHSPRNLAMALSVEASELLALYLWSTDEGPQPAFATRAEKVADELADCLICLLNLAERAEIDVGVAFLEKLEKNAEHYPVDLSQASAKKYDEF